MKTKFFQIGTLLLKMSYSDQLCFPPHFLLFECASGQWDYEYDLILSHSLPSPSGIPVAEREDLKIYQAGAMEQRLLGVRGQEGFYGFYEEVSDTHAVICFQEDCLGLLLFDTIFSSLLALERRVLSAGGLILHSAYVEYEETALLFSAPSGTGKSTQAELWEKYCGCVTQNGDRTLLLKNKTGWFAYGWPVCGSSEICNNTHHPLRAIVTLSQAPDNRIFLSGKRQAFTKLYSEITINRWNLQALTESMNLLDDLLSSVPVYHLACNISEDAVIVLKNMLAKDP